MAEVTNAMTSPHTAAPDRYDLMVFRRVGSSGLRLPAISLGLWQNFGDDRALATQRAIVRRAFDRGVFRRLEVPVAVLTSDRRRWILAGSWRVSV